MAVSEADSGTLTADGTEQTVDTYTGDKPVSFFVDLSNMASGDTTVLRVKDKIISSGSEVTVFEETFTDAQSPAVLVSEPLASVHSTSLTLEQTAGTNRNYDWSTREVT